MKEKIELIQITNNPGDGYLVIVESHVLDGYTYVVSQDAYQKLQVLYGDAGESDEAFAEDPCEWLVQLFDGESFGDVEDKIVGYFGSKQKAVAFMAVGSPLRDASFEETDRYKVSIEETDEDVSVDVLGDVFSDDEHSEEATLPEIINYLRSIDNPELQAVFLGLFSKFAMNSDRRVVDILFRAILEGLLDSACIAPKATEELVGKIMSIFLNEMGA